jgi:DNA-binding transcriptional MerR regulator
MFKIGEFSKLVQVPVPTLRYYDEVGLLKPVEVDRFTGYRYYSADQLPRLNRILALKGLGFSLEQISEVLAEGLSPEQMRGMFRLRHAQISQQLAEVQSQLIEVEVRLQQIEQEETLSTYDVILKPVETLLVASVRATLPEHNNISPLYAEVYAAFGSDAGEAGQTLAIWYDEDYKAHNVDGAAAFMLRSRIPESGRMQVHELPAATMATTIHHGSYNTLIKGYEAILKWIEPKGYQVVGPSREIYLYNTMPVNHDDDSYVTEIQFPVENAA